MYFFLLSFIIGVPWAENFVGKAQTIRNFLHKIFLGTIDNFLFY